MKKETTEVLMTEIHKNLQAKKQILKTKRQIWETKLKFFFLR